MVGDGRSADRRARAELSVGGARASADPAGLSSGAECRAVVGGGPGWESVMRQRASGNGIDIALNLSQRLASLRSAASLQECPSLRPPSARRGVGTCGGLVGLRTRSLTLTHTHTHRPLRPGLSVSVCLSCFVRLACLPAGSVSFVCVVCRPSAWREAGRRAPGHRR